ncbi:energy-coupling factor ABC transporter ATP-binding protein [Sporosalibacterium faouarense]|uniref:energy-coupling factor ABC transporter ATP-binding protein n=1 Tax=Sporosalibacterium faouarense TaxID=516123 RepID=UPI00192C7433|nr:ABC transporter ATP-binding protein [Sporosalibacterium faouarense]
MDIEIKNLKKYFGTKMILDIEELKFKKNIITGIIGPNGAGKSTLINILAGLDKEYQGSITYNKEKFNDSMYLDITLVFQKPYLLNRKVYEDVAYPLKIRKLKKSVVKEKTNEILKELGIYHLRDQKSTQLSGGEAQKVSLARAVIIEPELILLDEPTSSIDEDSISTLERVLKEYNKEYNTTIIIITHDIEQAYRLCDEIIFLKNGRVEDKDGLF